MVNSRPSNSNFVESHDDEDLAVSDDDEQQLVEYAQHLFNQEREEDEHRVQQCKQQQVILDSVCEFICMLEWACSCCSVQKREADVIACAVCVGREREREQEQDPEQEHEPEREQRGEAAEGDG